LYARCVVPSFIRAIFASGSTGDSQSAFDHVLSFRSRSKRCTSAAVGSSTPSAFNSVFRYSRYGCCESFRTIDRIAAFASSVVESTPTAFGSVNSFFSAHNVSTHSNTAA